MESMHQSPTGRSSSQIPHGSASAVGRPPLLEGIPRESPLSPKPVELPERFSGTLFYGRLPETAEHISELKEKGVTCAVSIVEVNDEAKTAMQSQGIRHFPFTEKETAKSGSFAPNGVI